VRRFHRSRSNRVLAGVCGGIAEHFGSDPTAVRLLTLVLGLFTGIFPMIVLYLIAAVIVPEAGPGADGYASPSVAPGQLALVVGALPIVAGIAGFANQWLRVDWNQLWPLVLIGMGALLLLAAARRR
jgi:phage shock protein C